VEPAAGPRLCPVLVGPTAAGKTDLLLELARAFPVTVLSLDSRQLYRGLRIGTAQPSRVQRAVCPHRLVDFLSPRRTYSARQYRRSFSRAWREERARGRIPVLVGGTGFYLQALTEGLPSPDVPRPVLAAVRRELAPLPDDEIRRRLRDRDHESWLRIAPRDRYRSQRALEILLTTGRPASLWLRRHRPRPVLGLTFPVVRLEPDPAALARRIIARTDAMLAGGWLDEVRRLLSRYPADCPGLHTLGYVQLVHHLQGTLTLAEAGTEIVLRTRQYARRQRTWFRRLTAVVAGRPDAPPVRRALADLVQAAGRRDG